MMSRMLVIFLASLFVGCAFLAPKEDSELPEGEPEINETVLKKFNQGIKELEQENYKEAARVFDEILVEHPTSEFELIALYNSAAAHEGMGHCNAAGRRYRQVTRASMGKFMRLEAQAFLRLSYAYECVGNHKKTIVSLIDVLKRKKHLPDEVVRAEVPARLAAAYARIGNRQEAQKYFEEAQKGLQYVQAKYKSSRQQQDILARTLFFMGKLNQEEKQLKVSSDKFLTSLRYLQPYLLKSVEMNSDKWSPKAAEQIRSAYENVWKLVQRAHGTQPQKSPQQKKQEQLVVRALQNLRELKEIRFPENRPSQVVQSLFNDLDKQEKRYQQFLATNAVSLPLTPEAEQRQGLKREGKVKSPETSLEKGTRKKPKLPEKGVTP